MILIAGELLPMSQMVTNSMILGAGRSRLVALVYLVEGALAVFLVIVLLHFLGLIGACTGLALAGILCRGLWQLNYGCRLTGVSIAAYLRHALLPPILSNLLPAFLLAALVDWHEPTTWVGLIACGGLYGVVYVGAWLTLFERERIRARGLPWLKARLETARP
jgi:O-antigen/teichoic acid export membrane protein